ncbi:hypothetical protein [Streptomyces sp. enrichment culture]|uniref:DODA-type extradiol aromatic ring-opening family dioxygenase n=1 Tax=Streptomyces sp. enrichment culture TaxID=1795815 RepID=UPI003F55D32E
MAKTEIGLPRMLLKGQEDLSAHILRSGLDAGFDLAFSNELRIDHSIACPTTPVRREADLPIVPIDTNIFAPPLPRPKRCVQLGQGIRQMMESWPSGQRVAVIGTGNLSLGLGGPRQLGEQGPDPQLAARSPQPRGCRRGQALPTRPTTASVVGRLSCAEVRRWVAHAEVAERRAWARAARARSPQRVEHQCRRP